MAKSETKKVSSVPNPSVLVVDDDHHVGRAIGRLLTLESISHEICENPRDALNLLVKGQTVFGLIISDQRMPEMKGTVFLEKAKAVSPETICFLITAYTDIDAIVDSVNKGAVYKYILKPWNDELLLRNIQSALKKFQLTIEKKALLETAIEQTKQLYNLSSKILKILDQQKKTITNLVKEANILEDNTAEPIHWKDQKNESERIIKELLRYGNTVATEVLTEEYKFFMKHLFKEFEELANRNGFSMPDPL